MNIFLLDYDVAKCARYHTDKHCVKMILEYAQLLSTTVRLAGIEAGYLVTHKNHPCAIWTRQSTINWLWLRALAFALCEEYTHRYGKVHKSMGVIKGLPMPRLPDGTLNLRNMPQCMPDQYKQDDPVQAYRAYYMGEKSHIFRWTNREAPSWLATTFTR